MKSKIFIFYASPELLKIDVFVSKSLRGGQDVKINGDNSINFTDS